MRRRVEGTPPANQCMGTHFLIGNSGQTTFTAPAATSALIAHAKCHCVRGRDDRGRDLLRSPLTEAIYRS